MLFFVLFLKMLVIFILTLLIIFLNLSYSNFKYLLYGLFFLLGFFLKGFIKKSNSINKIVRIVIIKPAIILGGKYLNSNEWAPGPKTTPIIPLSTFKGGDLLLSTYKDHPSSSGIVKTRTSNFFRFISPFILSSL